MSIDTLIQLSYETGYSAAVGEAETERCQLAVENRDKLRDQLIQTIINSRNGKRYYAFIVKPDGRTVAYFDSDFDALVNTVLCFLNTNYSFGLKNLSDLQARAYDLWIVVDFFKESKSGRLIPIY